MFDALKENETLNSLFTAVTLQHIFRAFVYLLIGVILIRLVIFLLRRVASRKVSRQSRMIVNKIISYSGMTVLLVIVLAELGVNLAALLGAAGILGLAVGVASQKSLGNIVSGIFLLSEKSFEVGDAIKVGDKTGLVQDVDLLSVKIRTFDNLLVRIPNETLISTEVTNITRFPIRRFDVELSVSYGDDLRKTEEVLRNLAQTNPLVLDEPAPLFLLKTFGDSGINLVFGIWFMKEDFLAVRNSMFRDIVDGLKAAGITIPFRQIMIHDALGTGGLGAAEYPLRQQKDD